MTWAKIVGAFVLVAAVAGGGWHLRGLKADADIEKLKREHAEADTKRITEAADKLVAGAETMNTAAINYSKYRMNLKGSLEVISGKIDTIKRPLPDDCRPDERRMLILQEAIEATNTSIRAP